MWSKNISAFQFHRAQVNCPGASSEAVDPTKATRHIIYLESTGTATALGRSAGGDRGRSQSQANQAEASFGVSDPTRLNNHPLKWSEFSKRVEDSAASSTVFIFTHPKSFVRAGIQRTLGDMRLRNVREAADA